MKTVLIEEVKNGFLVRPFDPAPSWATKTSQNIFVFPTMDALRAGLPEIFAHQETHNRPSVKIVNE